MLCIGVSPRHFPEETIITPSPGTVLVPISYPCVPIIKALVLAHRRVPRSGTFGAPSYNLCLRREASPSARGGPGRGQGVFLCVESKGVCMCVLPEKELCLCVCVCTPGEQRSVFICLYLCVSKGVLFMCKVCYIITIELHCITISQHIIYLK